MKTMEDMQSDKGDIWGAFAGRNSAERCLYSSAKRLMDFFLSILLLIAASPLILLIALVIKLDDRGAILYRQVRVGVNGRFFNMYKFRSMVMDAETRQNEVSHLNEVDGPVFKIRNDPRITRVGRLIRKLSLDELPQLINVVRGDMSLVGPRPPLPSEVDRYEDWHLRRLSVLPGITCYWQVSGRNELSFDEWVNLDLKYIDNWSLWVDIKLLMQTIPAVLTRRGAY